jgi:1-deoxy-D-xylulose-5-phosphate synthase
VVTVEDHAIQGGFGAAVAEHLSDAGLIIPVLRIGVPDRYVDHGSLNELYTERGWQPPQIATRVAEWLERTESGGARAPAASH